MSIRLIPKGKTPYQIVKLLATQPQEALTLKSFFAPRCDCNPVAYIKEQVQESNTQVRDALKAMIAAPKTQVPPANGGATPQERWHVQSTSGDKFVVLETFCDDQENLKARVKANHSAEVVVITLQEAHPECTEGT